VINADTQTQSSLLLKVGPLDRWDSNGPLVCKTTYGDTQDNLWGHRRQLMGRKGQLMMHRTKNPANVRGTPAVVLNELAAVSFEGAEVGISRIEDGGELVVGELDVAGEVQGVEVPLRILKDDAGEERICDERSEGWRPGFGAGDPCRPIGRHGSRRVAWRDLTAGGELMRGE